MLSDRDRLINLQKLRCEACEHKLDNVGRPGWCYMFEDFVLNCQQYEYVMSDADAHHALTGE